MEKIVERNMLYDFYGELLTPHQQEIYESIIFIRFWLKVSSGNKDSEI